MDRRRVLFRGIRGRGRERATRRTTDSVRAMFLRCFTFRLGRPSTCSSTPLYFQRTVDGCDRGVPLAMMENVQFSGQVFL